MCKKVRDDKNYWHQVEAYVAKRTDAQFSHGYCPECYRKAMQEIERAKQAAGLLSKSHN